MSLSEPHRTYSAKQILAATPSSLLHFAATDIPILTDIFLVHPQLRDVCLRLAASVSNIVYCEDPVTKTQIPCLFYILRQAALAYESEDEAHFKPMRFENKIIDNIGLTLHEVIIGLSGADWITIELISDNIADWINNNEIITVKVFPAGDKSHPLVKYFENSQSLMLSGVRRMARNRFGGYGSI